jgi:hypothetical protein
VEINAVYIFYASRSHLACVNLPPTQL